MGHNLSKLNLVLIASSFVVIVIGFILMLGAPSGATEYNPDIFSIRRITVGPMIAFLGFLCMIVSILYKPKKK